MVQEKDRDLFDYQSTVNALTIQFLSEHEETRVAALKWLIMLHQKAPKKVRRWIEEDFACEKTDLRDRFWLWTMGPFLRCSKLCRIRQKRYSSRTTSEGSEF